MLNELEITIVDIINNGRKELNPIKIDKYLTEIAQKRVDMFLNKLELREINEYFSENYRLVNTRVTCTFDIQERFSRSEFTEESTIECIIRCIESNSVNVHNKDVNVIGLDLEYEYMGDEFVLYGCFVLACFPVTNLKAYERQIFRDVKYAFNKCSHSSECNAENISSIVELSSEEL